MNDTKIIYRTLPCRLTQADIDQKNRYNGQDYNTLLDMAAKQTEIKKIMQKRNSEIHRGEEDRDVECRWEFDTKTEMKRLRRVDTQEVISVESMTTAELQEARQTSFDVFSDTAADVVGKGATTIETGIRWAGRRTGPDKGPGGEPVRKEIAIAIRPEDALWNGHRWLVQSDEADRSMTEVKVRTNEGEEKLHPMDSVWVSSWPEDPPAAEPAPKQLPPAPSPSTAELRAELDADEIMFEDLAADLRSLGKIVVVETLQDWSAEQCREAMVYVKLMDKQRLGVDVGDPVCPAHVAALPEPGEIVDAEFDDEHEDTDMAERTAAGNHDWDDAWEDELKAYPAPGSDSDAIPEPIEDEPVTPAKSRERKPGGKAKGKAGNGAKGRRKPADE